MSQHPFIYICALMRTGSTVISEALTQLPNAFIFREPHLGKNSFTVKPGDDERLRPFGISLNQFAQKHLKVAFWHRRLRWLGHKQDYMLRVFKQHVCQPLTNHLQQIGIKEISHKGWGYYLIHFPNMKVIVTGRDPRDIYISIYRRWEQGLAPRHLTLTPAGVSAHLNQEFAQQQAIMANFDHIAFSYETLCLKPTSLEQIRSFVGSPIQNTIGIGQFNATHPLRTDEYALHGSTLSNKRVQRWRNETDKKLLAQAQETFDLMPAYTKFWNYNRVSTRVTA